MLRNAGSILDVVEIFHRRDFSEIFGYTIVRFQYHEMTNKSARRFHEIHILPGLT
jgi:hypothetical protein